MMQTNTSWDQRQYRYYQHTYTQQAGEVVGYWKGILATLFQRHMLQTRPRAGGLVVPEADAYLFSDRCLFVLDMHRLGGIAREEWLKHELWAQFRAALKGRRVFVSDGGGLAITVARQPGERGRKRLPEQIALDLSDLPSAPYRVRLGETRRGPVTLDVADEHRAILIGATSGAGKTTLMKSIVLQLAARHPPEELQVAVVDPKRVDFGPVTPYARLPHLFAPVATMDGASELIEGVYNEFLRRQAVMAAAGVADWRELDGDDRLPLLLLVVDEVAGLKRLPAMDTLIRLAREGRAMGISLLVGTQHPTSRVLDSQVKANLPTRIAFQTATRVESQTILDSPGAEQLSRPGLALAFLEGRWQTVQTYWVEAGTAQALVEEASAPEPPALSDVEADLVRYAVEELDGAFTINKLWPPFKGRISKPKLTELGQQWQDRGWLTKPAHAADPRRVTDDLLALLPPAQSAETVDTRTRGTGGDTGGQGRTGPGQGQDTTVDTGGQAGTGPGTGVDTPQDTQDTPPPSGTGTHVDGNGAEHAIRRRPSVLAALRERDDAPLVG